MVVETKDALRRTLRDKRMSLTPEEVKVRSTAIVERVKQVMDWAEVRTLHCFEPLAALHEVDIQPLLTWLHTAWPNTEVFTSRKVDGDWCVVPLNGGQPVATVPLFDAVVVPMLGFSPDLHRLGYGGGYYDRLLAGQPRARTVGVCFELGRVAVLPTEPHDIPLDFIITERAIITTP